MGLSVETVKLPKKVLCAEMDGWFRRNAVRTDYFAIIRNSMEWYYLYPLDVKGRVLFSKNVFNSRYKSDIIDKLNKLTKQSVLHEFLTYIEANKDYGDKLIGITVWFYIIGIFLSFLTHPAFAIMWFVSFGLIPMAIVYSIAFFKYLVYDRIKLTYKPLYPPHIEVDVESLTSTPPKYIVCSEISKVYLSDLCRMQKWITSRSRKWTLRR